VGEKVWSRKWKKMSGGKGGGDKTKIERGKVVKIFVK
jgi:hypothetical protein